MESTHQHELPLNLRLVVIDETRGYADEIIALAGRIFQTYVYDANRPVNYCEITPSYELTPLNTTPLRFIENRDQREVLHEMITVANTREILHRYCKSIDRMPDKYKKAYHVIPRDAGETYDEQFASEVDHLLGNVQIELPVGLGATTYAGAMN